MLHMKLHILTYNMWGLNMEEKVHKFKIYLQTSIPHVHVMFTHEHKLRGIKTMNLGKCFWKDAIVGQLKVHLTT
jgi:hypothetical protein